MRRFSNKVRRFVNVGSALLVVVAMGLGHETKSHGALIAQWGFDANYQDTSGLANDLTPSGGPTFVPAIAPFGSQALNLVHTSSQYASDTTPNGTNFTNAYSVAGWVKAPLQGSDGHRDIFYRGNGTTRADVEIYVQQGNGGAAGTPTNQLAVAHNRSVSGAFDFTTFSPMPNNNTFFLTVTYDGSAVRAFYDGVEQIYIQGFNHATGATIAPYTPGNNLLQQPQVSPSYQVRVGSAPDLSAFFTGVLDEFKVYDHALDSQEMLNLMLFNSTVAPLPVPEPSSLCLLALGALLVVRRRGKANR